jgi:gamma-glutamylcyclotransferase (GGCT)/AIG2-like uncharacterized protein YtfP
MSNTKLPLFVYGTLVSGAENYAAFLAGRTTEERPAWIGGAALYSDGRYPYLVTTADLVQSTDRVAGTLVWIKSACYEQTMADIDWLEGYVEGAKPTMYERRYWTVYASEQSVRAWVYVAGPQAILASRVGIMRKVPHQSWASACIPENS